ncbi:MAG TPA: CHASE domain-containing protein [Noviherbaspirillum sp.]|nr:CHASE domain-containing protein [Noviherbaspirillum sp.]
MRLSVRFIKALLSSTVWWLGVAVSLVLTLLVASVVDSKTEAQFEYQVNNAQLAIQTRMRSYIDVLRGASALFYTRDGLTREQFHAYVSQLQLERSFPGVTNLNVAFRIPRANKHEFETAVRADTSLNAAGYPGFEIKPAGERDEYHVLTYLEPMETNLVSFGFDIASVEAVARALAVARDTGQLVSSGRRIQISGPHRHVGMAMRMPLYRRGMPLRTVAERRAAYYGSVGAGFDISKLLLGAVDKKTLPHLAFKIYDIGLPGEQRESGTSDPGRLMFDSEAAEPAQAAPDGPMFVKRVAMTVGPRVWEAEFTASKSAMMSRFDVYLPRIVLVVGLAAAGLLFSIYYSLTSARRRAVELAKEMTKDLRASEASLAEAQHMAHLGSWLLDITTQTMTWSAETFHIFGLERFSELPNYSDYLRRIHEEDRARVQAGLAKSLRSGEEFNTEHRIVRRDGTTRWVQTICRPSNNDGLILLRGTIMDITERKQTMEALKRSRELLRELTAHQDRVKEDERRRIAREIHDELGQTLLALRIDVSMLEARTGKSHPHLNAKVRAALQYIDATVKTIRTIINNLRPAVLDLGLSAAIEWQVNEFRRRSGISCELVLGEEEFAVDDTRATTLFRILQESLTNVIRHAKATHVLVELHRQDGQLVMKIADNGVGIYADARKNANSFGLVGVEERVHALNGKFLITSTPGHGTVLTIHIPLAAESRELRTAEK